MTFVVRSLLVLCVALPAACLAQTAPQFVLASKPNAIENYVPITNTDRFTWFLRSTLGPESLVAGMFSSGFATAVDKPKEYGPHWDGYGKRYAMRLTGVSTSNAMESGLGSLWHEDPRYFRAPRLRFKQRAVHVILTTFEAPRLDGQYHPAYARFIAVPANNFLSNTWRADSEADISNALIRTAYGFLGRMGGNAFKEFWPDVEQKLFHRE
jgi:hypothetical protein